MRRLWWIACAIGLLGLAACPAKKAPINVDAAAPVVSVLTPFVEPPEGGTVSASQTLGQKRVEKVTTRAKSKPKSGEESEIPAGKFPVGSTPGDEGREPAIEPALLPMELGAYQIDALPYPNDADKPGQPAASAEEAGRLCVEKGKRLCTELEWERACKGPELETFSTGARWDVACDKEARACESGFRVRALGAEREWTRSTFKDGGTVVRGGPTITGKAPAALHRCGKRGRADGEKAVLFRCCKGKENAQELPMPELRQAFKKTKMDAGPLGKILGELPELGRIGSEIHSFEGEVQSVSTRSRASNEGIVFTGSPVLWNPEPGIELLVATGRNKHLSFVVALYPLADEKYKVASFLLLLGDVQPIALAYDPHRRKELLWTSCFGCLGEGGSIHVKEDHQIVIVQH